MRKSHIVLPPPSPPEETETMTETMMRMETKATAAMAATAEVRRPAWRRWRQLGESAALAAASLAAEVAAW